MKKLLLGLFIFGLTTQIQAQTIELPETEITVNYKYLDAVDGDNMPARVKKLEKDVSDYRIANRQDLYDDEYDTYSVSFFVPEGKIVAAYDKNGKIVRTIEKYNNVRLPLEVTRVIAEKYPNWAIVEDVYLVTYHCKKDALKQVYKVKLKNNDEIIKIKTNEKGEFL